MPFENTIVPYRRPSKLQLPHQLPYGLETRLWLTVAYFQTLSQRDNRYSTNTKLTVWRTNTYIQTPLALNTLMWGSFRLAPIKWQTWPQNIGRGLWKGRFTVQHILQWVQVESPPRQPLPLDEGDPPQTHHSWSQVWEAYPTSHPVQDLGVGLVMFGCNHGGQLLVKDSSCGSHSTWNRDD